MKNLLIHETRTQKHGRKRIILLRLSKQGPLSTKSAVTLTSNGCLNQDKMITKEHAREIAEKYLKAQRRDYTSIHPVSKVDYFEGKEIPIGEKKGQHLAVLAVGYEEIWMDNPTLLRIYIEASTGEVLYTITPHGYWDK
jgi:hypothetical protein